MSDTFNLQEELLSLSSDPTLYPIPSELDIPSLSEGEIDAHLSSAIESLVNDPDSLTHSSAITLDIFRSIFKHSDNPTITSPILTKSLDAILSGLTHHTNSVTTLLNTTLGEDDVEAPLIHKAPLEIYAFLLQWFITLAEKGVGKSPTDATTTSKSTTSKSKKRPPTKSTTTTTFIWSNHLPLVLSTMHKTLRLPTSRIWRTTSDRESFMSCFTRSSYLLLESEHHLRSTDIKLGIYKTICLSVKFHNSAFGAQTSIIQNLTYFEHLSEPMAELLAILEKEFDYPQLGEEVLREVAGRVFGNGDAKGPRSFSRFLVRLGELSPRVVMKQMSLLLGFLDCEAHPMRMAIVEIIGLLIRDISLTDEGDEDQKKKQIKRFFELLMERYLDLNSWVRCKVLTTITKLCDLPTKFPKQRAQITDLTIRTLEDKTSSARRYSIQLLCKLLETHPFGALHGGTLNLGEWQERYDQISKELEKVDTIEMEKARQDAGIPESAEEADETEEVESQETVKTENPSSPASTPRPAKFKRKPRVSSAELAAMSAEQSTLDPALIQKLRLTKKYYSDALRFITQIESAIPTLCQLLVSTTKSEVLESMRFFRMAYEYNLGGAEVGIKTMLHLIWTKDNSGVGSAVVENEGGGGGGGAGGAGVAGVDGRGVRAVLVESYKSLYFDVVPDLTAKQQVNRIAKNMIERTYGATLAELTSLEELMRTMMVDGGVHDDVVNKLWQVYGTEQEIPKAQRQGAIIILGMLGLAKREVVTERVDLLLKIGLGNCGMHDLVLARYTCIALQRLGGSAKKVKGSLADKTMRLPMDSPIFAKLQDMIELAPKSPQWFGMAEQAINTIYLLGEQPDLLCGAMIKNLTTRVFSAPSSSANALPPMPSSVADETQTQLNPDETMSSPIKPGHTRSDSQASLKETQTQIQGDQGHDRAGAFSLAQLVFVVGHVAIKHIVYLELVEREFKRRKDENAKQKAASKVQDKDSNDLDAVAGNAEDDIGDLIAGIREKELLFGEKSLLKVYGPLIAHICASPKRYKSPTLRQAATLALTKLMCVSAQFCEAHLLLLFKILETSKDVVVRSNIVIALGDIAVCFGSMIDDNSERLYQGLSDPSPIVKKNTLMVLTHLILNGMIKVKGQLGEMAKCLEDPDPRISDLAKLFFTELSTKDNALYNNLQDVISHLSVGNFAVDEECFERTMRFIFTFIEKDKQAEAIVEKLCQRFRLATGERQWRDISFCLSLLPFKSDRSMKKLIEGLPFYQDKLHEETVFRRFTEILAKARANKSANKPETELNEFEAILNEHQAKGLEEQALEADVLKKTKAAKRKAAKRAPAPAATKGRGGGRGRKNKDDSEEEEEAAEEVEEREEVEVTGVKKGRGKAAPVKRGRRKVVESESVDEDEE